jgi:anti-anti-sigma factor
MAIVPTRTSDDRRLTIAIDGRFDFATHESFRQAYEHVARPEACVVDLSKTEYMDSSALGMLLIMREHFGHETRITLLHPNAGVRSVLQIANFQKIFEIA